MKYKTLEDFDLIMENVYGLVTIDMDGIVTYINRQVCNFCGIDYEWASSGRHVNEVFPFSKMTETLRTKEPSNMEFYHYNGITSASMRHPLIKDGEMVGVIESATVRLPLVGAAESDLTKLRAVLTAEGLL